MHMKQKRHVLTPINFAFTRERFDNQVTSNFSLLLLRHNVVSSFIFTAPSMTSSAQAVTSYFRAQNTALYVWSLRIFLCLFWLLRTQCKDLDEIKHLFGQFQTVYRNMAGL